MLVEVSVGWVLVGVDEVVCSAVGVPADVEDCCGVAEDGVVLDDVCFCCSVEDAGVVELVEVGELFSGAVTETPWRGVRTFIGGTEIPGRGERMFSVDRPSSSSCRGTNKNTRKQETVSRMPTAWRGTARMMKGERKRN